MGVEGRHSEQVIGMGGVVRYGGGGKVIRIGHRGLSSPTSS